MDQPELKVNIRNRCQARENACERGTIAFSFAPCWLKRKIGASFPNQSPSIIIENQNKHAITFTT